MDFIQNLLPLISGLEASQGAQQSTLHPSPADEESIYTNCKYLGCGAGGQKRGDKCSKCGNVVQ